MISFLSQIPPSFIILIGCIIIPLVKGNFRKAVILTLPILALFQANNIPAGQELLSFNIAGFQTSALYAHPYSRIFGTIFTIAAFAGSLFGLNQSKLIETIAAFLYSGAALGVVFSGDLISLFIYWEIMAIGSTIIILASDFEAAKYAGLRYAKVHFLGGVILLAGITAYINATGSIAINEFISSNEILFSEFTNKSLALWLILIGFLINAAAAPISAWLPDSYPVASPSGSVFLSAFTTKTSVFVLLTMFPGIQILVYIGLFMIFYGIVYAIMENDMRRILAYSIINQVGFMVTGIGIGTNLALSGVATHAFCHIIYKALLFMSAGSVLYMTGKSKCSELGGLYRTMKLTMICGTIGALAISAFPLTSGFVSKSMITSAAAHEYMFITWMLLVAASAGVFLHAGIKFPWFVFFQKDSGLRPKEAPANMRIAMVLLAALCIIPAIPGLQQVSIYSLLPNQIEYHSYTSDHVITQLQLLLFSGLAFFVMLPMLKRTETISLDFDWFYRRFGFNTIVGIKSLSFMPRRLSKVFLKKYVKKGLKLSFTVNGPEGILARNWPIGVTALWAVGLLSVYLILYYM